MGQAMRRGRPRKENVVRDGKGKSRGEIIDFSVVLNQPHRRHASGEARKSELLGYPLGRLRFQNRITETQLRAGNEWAELVRSYAATFGFPHGSARSGSLLSDSGKPAYAFSSDEAAHDAENDEMRRVSLRTRYNGCFEIMLDVGRSIGEGRAVLIIMRRVCLEERNPLEQELGNLRVGLNSVGKVLGIG